MAYYYITTHGPMSLEMLWNSLLLYYYTWAHASRDVVLLLYYYTWAHVSRDVSVFTSMGGGGGIEEGGGMSSHVKRNYDGVI